MFVHARSFFLQAFGRASTIVASAPGRIEFIGNHTDYNGGMVLGATIDRRVTVAYAPRNDRHIHLASTDFPTVQAFLDDLTPQEGTLQWANYVLGVVAEFVQAGVPITHGFDLGVVSTVPVGAGLSSSAALEVATAYALQRATGSTFTPREIARIGRHAENTFVGMPCGVLDQGVVAMGQRNQLVGIDCATETYTHYPLPEGTAFWLFNSHQQHSHIDSLYANRYASCQEAWEAVSARYPDIGCLAHATAEHLSTCRAALSAPTYARAMHVVTENTRVQQARMALHEGDLHRVGQLLTASHHSSRDLMENSTPFLDTLVDALVVQPGVYGARLTGGGFGGAVMAFTDATFSSTQTAHVVQAYTNAYGIAPVVLQTQTSEGPVVQ